jgi:hypothetical protein
MDLKDTIYKITQLQETEKQLYNALTQNAQNVALGKQSFSEMEIKNITDQINSLSAARVNLYNTVSKIYESQSITEQGAQKSMEQQTKTLHLLEQELNKAKKKLSELQHEKFNHLKMIEITTYYSKQYDAQQRLMKMIVIVVSCLLISLLLKKTPLAFASTPLTIFISVVGGFFIAGRIINIILRRNDNYDEFIWPMAPTTDKELANANKYKKMGIAGIDAPVCFGTSCCQEGTIWDGKSGCIVDK